jgi:integrase
MREQKRDLPKRKGAEGPNRTEQDRSVLSQATAQQLHNSFPGVSPDDSPAVRKGNGGVPRTDVRYWKKRVSKPTLDRGAKGYTSPFYSVQIAYDDGKVNKRVRFPLETANVETAASKAQSIYLSLVANGWDATLEKFKPQSFKPMRAATVGELIEGVRDHAGIRPATLNGYAIALRLIVSQLESIGDQPALDENGTPRKDRKGEPVLMSRYDYRTGGRDAWARKVDAVTLDTLTPDRIQKWTLGYIAAAGNAPDARRRAINSVNSNLRNARALFSRKAIKFVKDKLLLPDPLPFADMELKQRPPTKYISRIDAREILAAAKDALDPTIEPARHVPVVVKGRFVSTDPQPADKLSLEQFKILVLCLLCGLRRREADTLLWRQVDFKKGVLSIETTEYFQPKSEDSTAEIDLDDELLALLRGWKARAKGEFVIESPNLPRYDVSRANYRCERDFAVLNRWLKSQGVKAQKPIHEMRKELGAVLASEQGIFAAQRVLRHADVRTTTNYYADKKKRITSGLGSALAGMENVLPFDSTKPARKPKAV